MLVSDETLGSVTSGHVYLNKQLSHTVIIFFFTLPPFPGPPMQQARRYQRAGEIERGRRCGIGAYCCDTMAILVYVFTLIAAFVVIALWMTGVIFCSPLPQYSDKVCQPIIIIGEPSIKLTLQLFNLTVPQTALVTFGNLEYTGIHFFTSDQWSVYCIMHLYLYYHISRVYFLHNIISVSVVKYTIGIYSNLVAVGA